MRIPGTKLLRRSLWQLRGRIFGGGAILGYHRVAAVPSDPWGLCVEPRAFQAQMEVLRRDFRPVPLASLTVAPPGRPDRAARFAVAVTFDDGYADVLHAALPALERHDVPATVFVVPEAMRDGFWWDRLQWILDATAALPGELHLQEDGLGVHWLREQGLRPLHATLYGFLRSAPGSRRQAMLRKLQDWAGLGERVWTPTPLLSEEQVSTLDSHPLMEIGSHTLTHPELTRLTPESADHEIRGSRERLEALLDRPVESFCYPHGLADPAVRQRVAIAGYRRACASVPGLVGRGVDPFLLPRLWPGTGSADDFRRWLRGWTGW